MLARVDGVDAAFTTREGGVSTGPYASLNLSFNVGDDGALVVENRRRAAARIGASLDDVVFCEQVHGAGVAVVGRADRGRGARSYGDAVPGVDAIVTDEPGVGLAVLVADCVPIVLADPRARVVGVVHAGWRGTVAQVAARAVEHMASLGARPADVVALVGPAIPPAVYRVRADVAEPALEVFDDDIVRCDGPDHWRFDLWAANRRVLERAGVPPTSISVSPVGTGPGTPYFSHRAARPCGRFAALARLTP